MSYIVEPVPKSFKKNQGKERVPRNQRGTGSKIHSIEGGTGFK